MTGSTGNQSPGIRVTVCGSRTLVDHLAPSRRSLAVIALGFVAGLAAYPRFPSGFLPAFYWPVIAIFLPVTAAAILFSLQSLWNRDWLRDRDPESQATYGAIIFRLVLFIISLHGVLIAVLLGMFDGTNWAPRFVVVLFGLLVMSLGNLLPRTRPNLELGIRTRKTLTNRALWIRTHRTAGQLGVALGALIVLSGIWFSRATIPAVVGPASLAAAAALFLSYRWYSRA